MKAWHIFSECGGGKETTAMALFSLFMGGREKFFYYIAAWSFHIVLVGQGKLIYH
jgi:hypothetical protein